MSKPANQPETGQIERRLVAVLSKRRREAIWYAVLTVLCTPFFVVMISLAVMFIMAVIFRYAYSYWNARTFYTVINIFLASMGVFVLRGSNPPENPQKFDVTLLLGGGVFLLLLFVTYGTSLLESSARTFAVVYTVVSLLILALFGRVYAKMPVSHDLSRAGVCTSMTLLIFGLVAMAYGEIASSSWLWIPPDEDKIRVAAWILCKLAEDDDGRLDIRSADMRILALLFRLKFIQVRDDMLELTYGGYHFVAAAEDYAVE